MSVTSSRDPVQTLVDVLRNVGGSGPAFVAGFGGSTAGFGTAAETGLRTDRPTWPSNTAPDRIDRSEDHDPSDKANSQRHGDVSMYVAQLADGDYSAFSADGDMVETQTPQVEVWAGDSSTAEAYARAAVTILGDYHADNNNRTSWVNLFPDSSTDSRAQNWYYEGFAICSVQATFTGYSGF